MRRINKQKEKQDGAGNRAAGSRALAALKEAETLQQRAERKKGLEAVPACQKAVVSKLQSIGFDSVPKDNEAFRQALACPPPDNLSDEQRASAHFGMAATLQFAADCQLSGSRSAADKDVRQMEASARLSAGQLLQEAVVEYKQVREDGEGGAMRPDAMVNCGNALSELAGLVDRPEEALKFLGEAVEAYRSGLAQEEDAMTYVNLADALVAAADHLIDLGRAGEARQEYERAMQAYGTACGMSSSEAGDDVPGLLYNWGVGLHSAGTHLNDPAALKEAAEKLKAAKDFGRGDTVVMNALGDTLVAMSECTAEAASQKSLLQSALSEGYAAALRIDQRNSDALVGMAEVEMQLGRGCQGEEGVAHFRKSAEVYRTALREERKLGGFKDRSDVRYNFACASCLAGDPQGAVGVLELLLRSGSVGLQDILADPDLSILQNPTWLQYLQTVVGS